MRFGVPPTDPLPEFADRLATVWAEPAKKRRVLWRLPLRAAHFE
jgi:hypothetical protein